MSVLVCLEGLSGTGKSTIQRELLAGSPFAAVGTIPAEMREARRLAEASRDVTARHLLYASAVRLAAESFADRASPLLIESYIARTDAFHHGMGSRLVVDWTGLPVPDVTILLTCHEAERRERLKTRGDTPSFWRSRAEAHASDIANAYSAYGFVEVDTTDSPPTRVAQEVASVIRRETGCVW